MLVWIALVLALVVAGRRTAARELATFVPDCVVLFSRLARDERVPRRAKVAVMLLVPYLALPFDVVPDFIPVAGQLDDAILVALVLRYVVRVAGESVVREAWPGGQGGLRVILALATR